MFKLLWLILTPPAAVISVDSLLLGLSQETLEPFSTPLTHVHQYSTGLVTTCENYKTQVLLGTWAFAHEL